MRLTFTVEVEVERITGKFASRDELAEQMVNAIEGADEGTWYGDNEGEYETTSWSAAYNEGENR
jgi:seryl-tRNA(Sec) selenium transferase